MPKLTRWLLAVAVIAVGALVPTTSAPSAIAAPGQFGAPQVVLNPGGGTTAADGIRYTLNAGPETGGTLGGDALRYLGRQQYYGTSSVGPSLAIGNQTFSQAGFGGNFNAPSWTSLEVVRTTGSATDGGTGSASATLRYTAVVDGLSYVMERLVSYTYPNTFVTETYSFTIPEGNTKNLRFYLGGDTAPGGSDQGFGIMITQPTRTVISLNPSSGVQVAYRALPDSKPFDGAVSGQYNTPYTPMYTGGPIGFNVQTALHDAGLMVEWNLGSTPGTQTYSLEHIASTQGANLTATFGQTLAAADERVSLNIAVNNTYLEARSGIGYTIALPEGLRVAGAPTSAPGCAGTVTASGSTITTSGGSVAATSTCLISVPVVASSVGTYTITAASVTAITGATSTVGTTSFFVPLAPSITTQELPAMTAGVPYSTTVEADGAPAPEWAVTAGALPDGLRIDAVSGAITGTPTASGPWTLQLTATNVGGTDVRSFAGNVAARTAPLSLAFDPAVVTYGTSSTLAVQGVPAGATGTIAVTLDGEALCTLTLPTTTCTTATTLAPGTHAAVGTYGGDAVWAPAVFGGPVLVVERASAGLTGEVAQPVITFGETTRVALEVADEATGTVQITSGDRILCTVALPLEHECELPALAAGTYALAATYAGDERHLPGAAAIGTLVVERVVVEPGTVELDGVFGTAIPVSLPGLPASATGEVTVQLDGTDLCTYALGADSESCEIPAGTPAGSHALTLVYPGDANHEGVRVEGGVEIARAATTLTLPEGVDGVHGTATEVTAGLAPATATGLVTLQLGDSVLCEAAPGSPCVLPADLPAGTHEILASYAGDANHEATTGVVTVVVARAATAVAGEATATTVRTPSTVTVTGLPDSATGLVTVSHPELGTLCTIDVALASSCVTDGSTPAGTWALTLDYAGDANHEPSRAGASLVVERITTAFTAEVAPADVYATTQVVVEGLPEDATGAVVVTAEGIGTICTILLGSDTCESAALTAAGTYAVELDYSGDATYAPSSATAELVVAPLVTEVTASVEPVTVGEAAVVTITGLPATATGTVTVSSPELGDLCSFVLADGSGADVEILDVDEPAAEASSCETGALTVVGTSVLDVAYAGDANHLPSATTVEAVVRPITTAITVPERIEGVEGQSVTVTVSGLPEAAGGTVEVRVSAPAEAEAPDEDGTISLLALVPVQGQLLCSFDAADAASCTLPLDLVAGEHALTVTYLGDAVHAPSEATTTVVLTPAPVPGGEEPPSEETPVPAPTVPTPTASAGAGQGGALPDTGAGVRGAGLAALVLLAAGGALLLRRRTA